MLIQIDGWFAGGKGVLWALLDGHSEVFVNPIHDFSHSLLLNHSNDEEWLEKKHTTHLRKILAPSEYYKFEKIFLEKKLAITYASNNTEYINYDTDFYKFDALFIENLLKLDNWTIEKVIKELYRSYYEVYTQQNKIYPK